MMTKFNPIYKRFSEDSILIQWPSQISQDILFDIINFKKSILESNIEQAVQINNTYNSLLIIYNKGIDNFNSEVSGLKSLYNNSTNPEKRKSSHWKFPVCYDKKFGLDLGRISASKNIEISDLIAMLSNPKYLVYFIGFLPGFLYLGGMYSKLNFQRLESPRQKVEKGSVGIAGKQTGIYPNESPGGWNIIGNCPLDLFDIKTNPPCFAQPGDFISFVPISLDEHSEIKKQISEGTYNLKILRAYD